MLNRLNKMKIDFVGYSDSKGGAAKAMLRLYENLSGVVGVTINIYAVDAKRLSTFSIINCKSKFIFYYGYNFLTRIYLFLYRKLFRLAYAKRSINLFGIYEFEKEVDIYHLHWIHNETVSLFDILNCKKPVVWTLHDSWFLNVFDNCDVNSEPDTLFLSGYVKKIKEEISKKSNILFIVPNSSLKKSFVDLYGERNNCWVIPNPIDTDRWKCLNNGYNKRKDGNVRFLFSASSVQDPVKGWDVLVKAFTKLPLDLQLVFEFVVVGRGDVEASPSMKIVRKGFVSCEKEMNSIMASCDYTIVPSLSESFGQISAESMASGTPVIASKTGGLLEMVEHENNGYLFNIGDSTTLAILMERAANLSTEEYSKMSRAARSHVVANYSPSAVNQKYLDAYQFIKVKK